MAEHADKTTKARNPALSARTVKHLLVTLRGALSVAVKWDLVPRNVAALVEPPKLTKPKLKVFTTAIALGYRQGEALGLQWADVDLGQGTLTVRQALQRVDEKLRLIPTKADKVHTINLPAVTVSALHPCCQVERGAARRWYQVAQLGLSVHHSEGHAAGCATRDSEL